jgi:F0F1-type ATP synthase assembly protein I
MQNAIGLGYQFIAATLVFVGGGYYLDSKREESHLFTLIGVGLTFLYGGYEVWKLVRRMNDDT